MAATAKQKPRLTPEDLEARLERLAIPQNNCPVRKFCDDIDDDESRAVIEKAISLDKKTLPAPDLVKMLEDAGYSDVPRVEVFNDHRAGRRPCRCRA